jgi:hypothetical protein
MGRRIMGRLPYNPVGRAEAEGTETLPMESNERASLCYAMAYFALPSHLFQETERVLRELSANPEATVRLIYTQTCKAREKQVYPPDYQAFAVHSGVLNDRHDYQLIQYPNFPPVNLTDVPADQLAQRLRDVVLAPYFSAVVVSKEHEVKYFVLGQAPDGHTTLRGVSLEVNANLGRGCEPNQPALLALLRERFGAAGARRGPGPSLAKKWWEFWK